MSCETAWRPFQGYDEGDEPDEERTGAGGEGRRRSKAGSMHRRKVRSGSRNTAGKRGSSILWVPLLVFATQPPSKVWLIGTFFQGSSRLNVAPFLVRVEYRVVGWQWF